MKTKWLRGLYLLPFLGLFGCGGGGGGGEELIPNPLPNTAPVANFAYSCTDLNCSFTSTSRDNDVGGSIAAYNWTFGDGTGDVTQSTTHSYTSSNTYDVTLKVTDNAGATATVIKKVTVIAPTPGLNPTPTVVTSKFTISCLSLDCTFTDASSSNPPGQIQAWKWEFGDGAADTVQNPPVHHYNVTTLTTFDVKLTVTGFDGATSMSTQSIPVAPPASTLNCVGGNCIMSLTQPASVTVTLVSSSCGAHGDKFVITAPAPPAPVTILDDGCYAPVGAPFPLNGGGAFPAGTQIEAEVLSALSGTTGLVFDPAIQLSGNFSTGWTLVFDDGAGGPGEPDFNDLVILIKATP